MEKLFCIVCRDITNHNEKFSALLEGKMVCDTCSNCNSFCSLIKTDDSFFIKQSKDYKWIEFDEEGKGSKFHDKAQIGFSLIMSPFNFGFTWQTTAVTDIINEDESHIHFLTKNSEYIFYFNNKIIKI